MGEKPEKWWRYGTDVERMTVDGGHLYRTLGDDHLVFVPTAKCAITVVFREADQIEVRDGESIGTEHIYYQVVQTTNTDDPVLNQYVTGDEVEGWCRDGWLDVTIIGDPADAKPRTHAPDERKHVEEWPPKNTAAAS